MKTGQHKSHLSRGFTLLEILVAFAILIGSIGFLYQIYNTALERADKAKHSMSALAIARSKMAEIAESQVSDRGSIGQYTWQTEVFNNRSEIIDEQRNSIKLIHIQTTVYWTSNGLKQSIQLDSLRPLKAESHEYR